MYASYSYAGTHAEIDRIVDQVIDKLGVSEGQQLSPEQQKAFVGEVAQRLTAWTLSLPFEQQLTSEEIDRLLKNNKN
jgi:hypothetical protein